MIRTIRRYRIVCDTPDCGRGGPECRGEDEVAAAAGGWFFGVFDGTILHLCPDCADGPRPSWVPKAVKFRPVRDESYHTTIPPSRNMRGRGERKGGP